MKKMKRFAALLIAFAVVAATGIFSVPVFAEDAEIPTGNSAIEITEADRLLVEKLEAFGIVKDIDADLTAYVTRREMAELVTDYMRIPAASTDYDTVPFIDVSTNDPSVDAIMALYNTKIVTGDDAFRFYPESYLNYDEALVFVVNAVGYKMFAVRDGGFPTGYHRVAIKLGMLKDLAMQSGRDDITRLDVYKLFEAGLRAAAITYGIYTENETEYTVSTTDDFLSDTYGITTHKGIITGNEDTHLQSASSGMTDEQIEIDYTLYDTPGYIYATSLGRSVVYYLRQNNDGNKEIAYIEESDTLNNVVKVNAQDIDPLKTTATRVYYNDEEGKEYHIDFIAGVDVIYNGRAYRGYGNIAAVLPTAGYIEALDNNGDDVADVLFVSSYENAMISSVDTYSKEIITSTGSHFPCDVERGNAKVFIAPEMNKSSLKNIPINSIVSIMESKGTPKLRTYYVSTDVVSGQITETYSDGTIVVEGNKYKKAADYADTGTPLTVGTSVMLRLDYNGDVAIAEYGSSNDDGYVYAVLAAVDYEQSGLGNNIKLKLFTKSGFVYADLNDTVRIDDIRYELTDTGMSSIFTYLSSKNLVTLLSGRYAVTKANIIRCKLEGQKVAFIDTGMSGNEGSLRPITDSADYVVSRGSIVEIKNVDPATINSTVEFTTELFAYHDPSNPPAIFAAPVEDDPSTPLVNEYLADERGFSYKGAFSQKIYRNYAQGSQYTEMVDHAAVYTMTNTGSTLDTISALLLRGGGTTVKEITATTGLSLISKITTALDSEGFTRKKFYYGKSGAMLADNVTLTNNTHDAVEFSSSAPEINALKPGDILQLGYNQDGQIDTIKVISEYNSSTHVLTSHVDISDYSGESSKLAVGVVTGTEPNMKAIVMTDSISGTSQLCRATDAINIYRAADNEVMSAVLSEISVGDKIVVRIADYFDAPEIYVFR